MSEPEIIFDPENKIDVKHGYLMFIGTIISFSLANWVVSRIGPPSVVKGDEWRWNNLVISWVHAAICGTWDILCFVVYPELMDDLVHHINYFTYLMVAFSTGYFVYDFLDLAFNGKLVSNWEVTLHHIAVASMFWYNFHCKMCIAYNVIALMAEINSFFLHSRKLLHMLKFKFENQFYLSVCLVNLISFLLCRGLSLYKISYGMFTDYDNVPVVYFRCLSLSIFVMNVINPVLFWRLFKNDILRNTIWKRKDHSSKTVLNGNNNQNAHLKSKST
ncbi:TLC domain-containing protein 1 [Mactra antiquata]